MTKTKADVVVAKIEDNTSLVGPDYLTGNENTGMGELGQGDYKIPRMLLLQPLSPAVRSFKGEAIPGSFWHNVLNTSLGTSFSFVPIIARKRIIVWRPRGDDDGGILAYSEDGVNWVSGANSTFKIKLKGKAEPVEWRTGKNVLNSGLLNWGTSDPDDMNSAPAATTSYEYLCHLIDRPEASPIVMSLNKTSLPIAKGFNTSLMMTKKPIYCIKVVCSVEEQTRGKDAWYVPKFKLDGYVDRKTYEMTKHLSEQYQNYKPDVEEEIMSIKNGENTSKIVDDQIPF